MKKLVCLILTFALVVSLFVIPSVTSASDIDFPIRLNVGGVSFVDGDGNRWQGDRIYQRGSFGYFFDSNLGNSSRTGSPRPFDLSDYGELRVEHRLYHTERIGEECDLEYRFDIPNGDYIVNFKWLEFWMQPTERVFNVVIQGETVLEDFEVSALAMSPKNDWPEEDRAPGKNVIAPDTHFETKVTDGTLSIIAEQVRQNPKFTAIEVWPKEMWDPPTNTATVIVDGELAPTGYIFSGRTLLPMRAIFETLGADVGWDGRTRTVTATRGDTELELVIDNNVARVNGENVTLDVAPRIMPHNDRTYVPVRFISETLGSEIEWESETRKVFIDKPLMPYEETPPRGQAA